MSCVSQKGQETPSHPVYSMYVDPPGNEGLRIRVARSRPMAKLIKAEDEDAAWSEDEDHETEAADAP